jgi:hypothetical protein
MLLPLMLLLGVQDAGQDSDRVAPMLASAKALTRADVPCELPKNEDEIVVCSRRDADRYRVPLVAAGSVANSVPLRTATLTSDHSRLPCGQGAFIAQCGPGFGVGITVGSDGSTRMIERELAP